LRATQVATGQPVAIGRFTRSRWRSWDVNMLDVTAAALTVRATRQLHARLGPVWFDAVLALGGVAAAVIALAVATSDTREEVAPLSLVLGATTGAAFVGSGLLVRASGASQRLGTALALTGVAWYATALQLSTDAAIFTLGVALDSTYLLGIAYLLLAFPTGRLSRRLDRALIAFGVVLLSVWQLGWMVVLDSQHEFGYNGPDNLLLVSRHDALADAIVFGQRTAGFAVSAFSVLILVARCRRATRPERRATAPVLLAGAAFFATVFVSVGNDALDHPLGDLPETVMLAVVTVVPVAFCVALLRQRLLRGNVASLLVELGDAPAPTTLRDALARALGDPTVEVAYRLPDGRYVDRAGRPADVAAGKGRASTPVQRDGETIAVLLHDPALERDPALAASVGAAAGLALHNERLQAELRSRLDELEASRSRIVEAADVERRRIERNLHDGAQQRLVSIAMALGLAEARLANGDPSAAPLVREARESLLAALEELRELGRGIHPPVLAERGLAEALAELAYRAPAPVALDVNLPTRPPEAVEAAAYYVASESLANVAKHAGATRIRVGAALVGGKLVIEVEDDGRGGADVAGSGLRGLHDRVEALGGRLDVASTPGRGTRVRAELPCG
jgi:signal transduction histidine kinase